MLLDESKENRHNNAGLQRLAENDEKDWSKLAFQERVTSRLFGAYFLPGTAKTLTILTTDCSAARPTQQTVVQTKGAVSRKAADV